MVVERKEKEKTRKNTEKKQRTLKYSKVCHV
jgi:hypothetical protein